MQIVRPHSGSTGCLLTQGVWPGQMLAVQPNMLVTINPTGNVWKSITVMAYFIVARR
jgi:hypothetical protein